eukprot:427725-Pyramimonas_sp.AAC.2
MPPTPTPTLKEKVNTVAAGISLFCAQPLGNFRDLQALHEILQKAKAVHDPLLELTDEQHRQIKATYQDQMIASSSKMWEFLL